MISAMGGGRSSIEVLGPGSEVEAVWNNAGVKMRIDLY
jgi:hypothetical protein